jgi:hypothetical protein
VTAFTPAAVTPSLETIGPGFAGFLAIFGVAVATVLLLRSMVGHLRKVRYSPDPAAQDHEDAPAGAAADPSGGTPSDRRSDTRTDTPGDTPGPGA